MSWKKVTRSRGQLGFRHSGFGVKRDDFLRHYESVPFAPVMWRVYSRDDAVTRKNEELFQQWRGAVDFAYRRPQGQTQHPKWMRQKYAERKFFELEPATNTERVYLGFTANYLFAHWTRRGAVIPPVELLDLALAAVESVKDLGYATKMLRTFREHFNVHLEHPTFTLYMAAALRVGCADCALYALNQARWLGFASVKERDREFLLGKRAEIDVEGRVFRYEEDVKAALDKAEEHAAQHAEPTAEAQDYTPFAKFWRQFRSEQGWWVYPWEKDPTTSLLKHYWRHPSNVDPRHGTAYTEWTDSGTPLATDPFGVPTDPIGEAAVRAAPDEADAEMSE